jgi:hypothetical protein
MFCRVYHSLFLILSLSVSSGKSQHETPLERDMRFAESLCLLIRIANISARDIGKKVDILHRYSRRNGWLAGCWLVR